MSVDAARDNLRGGAWLIADFSLNIWALSIVKALGAEYASFQIVFLRAAVGLLLIAPLIWHQRRNFRAIPDLGLHVFRVVLSCIALTASFYAIARVPLALFTAVGFTRPLVTMVLAAVILREWIGPRRWVAAGIALIGIVIAVDPQMVAASWGLAAMAVVVAAASGVVIATRRLRDAPPVVMMAFYTVGLSLVSAPFATATWVPIAPGHLAPLLLVGVFAQVAQLCYLRAHYFGDAGFLSVLSYLSLLFSVGVGFFVFDEVPTPSFALGAALVVVAALWVTMDARNRRAVAARKPRRDGSQDRPRP